MENGPLYESEVKFRFFSNDIYSRRIKSNSPKKVLRRLLIMMFFFGICLISLFVGLIFLFIYLNIPIWIKMLILSIPALILTVSGIGIFRWYLSFRRTINEDNYY